MKKIIIITIVFTLFSLPVFALDLKDAFPKGESGSLLDKTAKKAGYNVQYEEDEDLLIQVAKIINIAISFIGVIFLILTIYGGFRWMTARGDEKQVEESQKIIKNAVIGIILIVCAYALSYFVVYVFTKDRLKNSGSQNINDLGEGRYKEWSPLNDAA